MASCERLLCIAWPIALIATQNPYIGVEKFPHEAALLGHEYEDENDDDDHGCGAAVPDR